MSVLNICMLGGTGFVGRSIASKLAAQSHKVRVFTRRRERNRAMLVLPTLTLVEGDVSELGFLREQFQNENMLFFLFSHFSLSDWGMHSPSLKTVQPVHHIYITLPIKEFVYFWIKS